MSKVLLDENVPVGLRRLIVGHEVGHVVLLGWEGGKNGQLIAAAEQAGYDVLVTADQNVRHQQNLSGRSLALVVLDTNRWVDLRRAGELVQAAIDGAESGGFRMVAVPKRERPRSR